MQGVSQKHFFEFTTVPVPGELRTLRCDFVQESQIAVTKSLRLSTRAGDDVRRTRQF